MLKCAPCSLLVMLLSRKFIYLGYPLIMHFYFFSHTCSVSVYCFGSCVAFPSEDWEIADSTLQFWY